MVYEYTLSEAKWGTIIIPFSCAKPDGLKLYEALSLDENGKIVMNEVDRFEANTPYIVGGTPGQYKLEGYAGKHGGGSSQPTPAKPKRTLTVRSANESQGNVSGGGTFDEGSTQTVQATPKTGYAFDKWSDGNMENPRTVKLTSDLTLTASFKVDTTGGGDQGGDTLGD